MRQKWIFCGGMQRAGSTLQYQIVSHLVEKNGIGARMPFLNPIDLEKFIASNPSVKECTVLKTHIFSDNVARLFTESKAMGFYVYRDLRDVVVSMANKNGISVMELVRTSFLEKLLEQDTKWTHQDGVFIFRYEDMIQDLSGQVKRIAAHLGLEIDNNEAEGVAKLFSISEQQQRIANYQAKMQLRGETISYDSKSLLHYNHINSGKVGQWREVLTDKELVEINSRAGEWLFQSGYSNREKEKLGARERISGSKLFARGRTFEGRYIFKYWPEKFWFRTGRFIRRARDGSLWPILSSRFTRRWHDRKTTNRQQEVTQKNLEWARAKNFTTYVDTYLGGGSKLRLYADSRLSEEIFFNKFEVQEQKVVRYYLRRGDVFIDIGANIGLFTVIAARQVGKTGRVFAFEPVETTRIRLEENIRLNELKNVTVFQAALSNTLGLQTITVPTSGHDAWSSLGNPIAGAGYEQQRVIALTFDALFASDAIKKSPTMIKLDVEGWESNVIKGANRTLRWSDAPLIQVEFTDDAAIASGGSCAGLYKLLESLGYTICRYDSEKNMLIPERVREAYPYINMYATKNITKDNARLSTGAWMRKLTAWLALINVHQVRHAQNGYVNTSQ